MPFSLWVAANLGWVIFFFGGFSMGLSGFVAGFEWVFHGFPQKMMIFNKQQNLFLWLKTPSFQLFGKK